MNTVNYQKELDACLSELQTFSNDKPKTLLLHSCCAPCSSYVLLYLRNYFAITVFYYNPNISMETEYQKRVEEQKRLIAIYNEKPGNQIKVIEGDYEPEIFFEKTKSYKDCKEGGERCFLCYELRLRKTALKAKTDSFDYFATTLTISPLKNTVKLNEIGYQLAKEYGVMWLPSDFKKKDGYKQSIELSKEYNLYRQDYCGCIYSKLEREEQKQAKQNENFLQKKICSCQNEEKQI